MPIQHAIWQVGAQPTLLASSKLVNEQQLEDMIVREALYSAGADRGSAPALYSAGADRGSAQSRRYLHPSHRTQGHDTIVDVARWAPTKGSA